MKNEGKPKHAQKIERKKKNVDDEEEVEEEENEAKDNDVEE